MRFFLVLLILSMTACGSTYEFTTPDGVTAKVRTYSNTDFVRFKMRKEGENYSIDLHKVGTDNSAAYQSLDGAVDAAASVVPLLP